MYVGGVSTCDVIVVCTELRDGMQWWLYFEGLVCFAIMKHDACLTKAGKVGGWKNMRLWVRQRAHPHTSLAARKDITRWKKMADELHVVDAATFDALRRSL